MKDIAKRWGTYVAEKDEPDGARRLVFRDESFSGVATIKENDKTTDIDLRAEARWVVSIEVKADVVIEDGRLTASAHVPFLLKGLVRRELQAFLRSALWSGDSD